ncbi:MAG TPA: non-homologous end-joining DNA ligase [Actinomycetota bacterium]|nr:non-homologous end-joining DNA ligase [Actinomycetota bacterium]
MGEERRIEVGGREVRLTSPEKVLFPDDGITKSDLFDYYVRIADRMLPHIEQRPLTMHRFPEGIGQAGFMQKSANEYFPPWIGRFEVAKQGGGTTRYPVVGEPAALAYLTNQNTIVHHVWTSRIDAPDRPDQMVFDLDPSGSDFDEVRRTALDLRTLLDELGLPAFCKTSGSKGLHIVVPLRREHPADEVQAAAETIAEELARRAPDRLTTEFRKAERHGRLYLDVGRNRFAQTVVAPYSARALPGAPVSTPIDWDEVASSKLDPRRWTISNLFRRLGRRSDPWEGMGAAQARIGELPS